MYWFGYSKAVNSKPVYRYGKIETRFDVRREGNVINIRRQGSSKAWNVVLVGINSVENIENTEIEIGNGFTFVRVNGEINELVMKLYQV
jgi:hypothetical protein